MRARDVLGVVDIERSNLSLYEERATLELPLSKATRIVRLYLQGVPSQNVFFKRAKNVRKPICR